MDHTDMFGEFCVFAKITGVQKDEDEIETG
jgi:hypothetical protein